MSKKQSSISTEPAARIVEGADVASLEKRGISPETWRVLRGFFPPEAPANMVLMAVDYCLARGLDPLKRPVHLIQYGGKWQLVPGIVETRITAARTGAFAGRGATEFGDDHEWARATVYRMVQGQRCEFVGPVVYFDEAAGKTRNGDLMGQWKSRPVGMLEKAAEAAALRCAFPEETGDDDAALKVMEPEPDTAPVSSLAEISQAARNHEETEQPEPDTEPDTDNQAQDETDAPLF